jgi:acyl dehydratase
MGDENPLHVDPASAKASGYDRPILHGAATFGIAAHAILRTAAGYDPARLRSIEARFSRPVFPGETIRTELWRDRDVSFRCRVVGRDEIVLTNGLARLR